MPQRWSRRQVVQGAAGLGLLAGCGRWPGQVAAPTKVPRIGYLSPGFFSDEGLGSSLLAAFQQGLREHGYVEGQNIAIEYRWAGRATDRLPTLAAELVQLPVDVIIAGGPSVRSAQQATNTIPIVIVFSGDVVQTGLVASLAHPGGNTTGVSFMAPDLGAKRLQLLKEAFPNASRVAAVWNPAEPASALEFKEVQSAAPTLGVTLQSIEVRLPNELESAFEAATREHADALITFAHAFTIFNARQTIDLTAQSRLPAMYGLKEFVEEGGLMAYGPNLRALYHRAAYYVDRILQGTKPADLPIEQPMRFDYVINLKTAQALGLTIPQHVLLQATEVIQ
jgi:putative tryptophan/tyrosine transport system substrate-binding protein